MYTIKAKHKRWGIWEIDGKLKCLYSLVGSPKENTEYYLLLDDDTILCSVPKIT